MKRITLFDYLDLANTDQYYLDCANEMEQDYEEFKDQARNCFPTEGMDEEFHRYLYNQVESELENISDSHSGFSGLLDIINYVNDSMVDIINQVRRGEVEADDFNMVDVVEEAEKWLE